MLLFLVLTGVVPLSIHVLWLALSTWRSARHARRLGCKTAPMHPSTDPWGISDLLEIWQADRKRRVLSVLERRVERTSAQEGRRVSTFRIRQIGQENLFTCDPINIQTVLATKFKDFDIGAVRTKGFRPLLGQAGIFTSTHANWITARGLLRPHFGREQISHLHREERHVQKAMRALPILHDGWTATVDLQSIFLDLTLDSSIDFLLGENVNSSQGQTDPTGDFADNFDRAQWYCTARVGLEKLYWLLDGQEFQHSCHQVHAFIDRFIEPALQTRLKQGSQGLNSPTSPTTLLHALASTTQRPADLRSHILNIIFAGRDTTAALLSWTMLQLARYPAVLQKLRQAILADFGHYHSPQDITFTSLKNCHYLQWCLKEVLRLYPPIPLDYRCAIRDTILPRGGGSDGESPILVRKGQSVMYHPYVLHRCPDIWGDDASRFDPDRWSDLRPGWGYLPFHGGPRNCIGQQRALTVTGYVLVRLLQRFDQVEVDDVHKCRQTRYRVALVSHPADGLMVRLHEADE